MVGREADLHLFFGQLIGDAVVVVVDFDMVVDVDPWPFSIRHIRRVFRAEVLRPGGRGFRRALCGWSPVFGTCGD